MTAYVDGKLMDTEPLSGPADIYPTTIYIGANGNSVPIQTSTIPVLVDDVGVYPAGLPQ
jgi:hypothetical protein